MGARCPVFLNPDENRTLSFELTLKDLYQR
jgi:hypothetical protein